jgi:hypothetical protein
VEREGVDLRGKGHVPGSTDQEDDMKLLRSAIVAGIAKKVIDEARKPQNQAKIKSYIAQATSKNKGSGGGTPGRRPY